MIPPCRAHSGCYEADVHALPDYIELGVYEDELVLVNRKFGFRQTFPAEWTFTRVYPSKHGDGFAIEPGRDNEDWNGFVFNMRSPWEAGRQPLIDFTCYPCPALSVEQTVAKLRKRMVEAGFTEINCGLGPQVDGVDSVEFCGTLGRRVVRIVEMFADEHRYAFQHSGIESLAPTALQFRGVLAEFHRSEPLGGLPT